MNPFKEHIAGFSAVLCIFLTALLWTAGCATTSPDPLAGWQADLDDQPDQSIVKDYQGYIQELPTEERNLVDSASVWFFKDGTGRHAIKIQIPLNGVWWDHVLIYDKNDKRRDKFKNVSGRYRS
jgi:hypothetical protein